MLRLQFWSPGSVEHLFILLLLPDPLTQSSSICWKIIFILEDCIHPPAKTLKKQLHKKGMNEYVNNFPTLAQNNPKWVDMPLKSIINIKESSIVL